MIPLKDDVPTRSVPGVTIVLVALNSLVYLYELWPGVPAVVDDKHYELE